MDINGGAQLEVANSEARAALVREPPVQQFAVFDAADRAVIIAYFGYDVGPGDSMCAFG